MQLHAPDRSTHQRDYSGGAVALTATAGILMVMVGFFHAIQGLVALVNDDVLRATATSTSSSSTSPPGAGST